VKKRIWVITLFPDFFDAFKEAGIISSLFKGQRGFELVLQTVQLREYSSTDYKGVDDAPYGGGPGMVMRADVLARALNEGVVKAGGYDTLEQLEVIYTSPRGETWNHDLCQEFAQTYFHDDSRDLVFICGRYEGIDERFIERYVTRILSLGDYVLTGGELAVMAMIDSFVRFIPGVLGNRQSALEESFQSGLLEHPQYTRPRVFEGLEVPQVLLSGHHEKIQAYQTAEQLRLTKLHRPELLPKKDHP